MKFFDNNLVKKSKKPWSILSLVSLGLVGVGWILRRESRRRKVIHQVQAIDQKVLGILRDVRKVYHDFFIPHHGNNHQPKILHSHAVRFLVGSMLTLKVILVVALFIFFPQAAWLSATVEQQMVDLTNDYRQTLGAPLLIRNHYLDSVARERAVDMIDRDYFSHYTPEGKKPWQWIDQSQYRYERFGENLAVDFITAKAVLTAFQASPTHDKNLRNPEYLDIGVAVVSGNLENRETNLMVVFYGATANKPPVIVATEPTPIVSTSTPPTTTVPVTPPVIPEPPTSSIPVEPVKPRGIVVYESPTTSVGQIVPEINGQPTIQPEVAGVEQDLLRPAEDQPVTLANGDSWIKQLIQWSNDFYFLLLLAFTLIAVINIVVAIRIQHRSIIIASLITVLFAGSLWVFDWHRLESMSAVMRILGWS